MSHFKSGMNDESPETTNIKTLPLLNVTLPKMTVCPPKDTFTDLNYDLWQALENNPNISDETWKELAFKAIDIWESNRLEDLMENITKLYEKDQFFNWYHGYTDMSTPFVDEYTDKFTYRVRTGAV